MSYKVRVQLPVVGQVGQLLVDLRKSRDLNKSELGRLLGVAWPTVHAWETRGVVPSRDMIAELIRKLRLTTEEQAALQRALNSDQSVPEMPASDGEAEEEGGEQGPVDSRFGAYLQHLREKIGLTKAGLARKLSVSWATVNAWETRGAAPRREMFEPLKEALELKPGSPEARAFYLRFPHWAGGLLKDTTLPAIAEQAATIEDPLFPPRDDILPLIRLERMLSKAMDPARHSFRDAADVFEALREGAADLVLDEEGAGRLLDVAASLRAAGRPVTGTSLAIALLDRVRS